VLLISISLSAYVLEIVRAKYLCSELEGLLPYHICSITPKVYSKLDNITASHSVKSIYI